LAGEPIAITITNKDLIASTNRSKGARDHMTTLDCYVLRVDAEIARGLIPLLHARRRKREVRTGPVICHVSQISGIGSEERITNDGKGIRGRHFIISQLRDPICVFCGAGNVLAEKERELARWRVVRIL
jgi:hypothetical protein